MAGPVLRSKILAWKIKSHQHLIGLYSRHRQLLVLTKKWKVNKLPFRGILALMNFYIKMLRVRDQLTPQIQDNTDADEATVNTLFQYSCSNKLVSAVLRVLNWWQFIYQIRHTMSNLPLKAWKKSNLTVTGNLLI